MRMHVVLKIILRAISNLECLVNVVSNKCATKVLLPVDPKGLEGIVQTLHKWAIMSSKLFVCYFGGVGYFLLLS